MPVTAKLSRKFYERLGDDIAGELVDWFNAVDSTYQTQLREVNDLNWERFKAELHGAESGLRAEFRGEMRAQTAELKKDAAEMEARLTAMILNARTDMIKWSFMFWTATMVPLLWAILRR